MVGAKIAHPSMSTTVPRRERHLSTSAAASASAVSSMTTSSQPCNAGDGVVGEGTA